MKILCIEDLDGFCLTKKGNFNKNGQTYHIDECIECGDWFYSISKIQKHCSRSCSMIGEKNPMFGMFGNLNSFYGKKHTEKTKEKMRHKRSLDFKKKMSNVAKKRFSKPENNINWKGGYDLNNIPTYNIYANQIDWCESVRRNKQDENILEVKCAYCGKWYIPKLSEINSRISAINNNSKGEMRLYCSKSCKNECPIYNQKKWPKEFKIATSREVQPELRQMVLKRDNYTCQKCGSNKSLHCHHLEGILWEPLESADIDKCITLCKKCHKEVHKLPDCGYSDMKCKRNIKELK